MTLPGGTSVTYKYISTNGRLDNNASRVTWITRFLTTVAEYAYNGVAQVVGIDYAEPNVMSEQFTTTGIYPDLDHFNRVKLRP